MRQAVARLDRQDRPQHGAESASFSHGAEPTPRP